jgi:hypothetical protein
VELATASQWPGGRGGECRWSPCTGDVWSWRLRANGQEGGEASVAGGSMIRRALPLARAGGVGARRGAAGANISGRRTAQRTAMGDHGETGALRIWNGPCTGDSGVGRCGSWHAGARILARICSACAHPARHTCTGLGTDRRVRRPDSFCDVGRCRSVGKALVDRIGGYVASLRAALPCVYVAFGLRRTSRAGGRSRWL